MKLKSISWEDARREEEKLFPGYRTEVIASTVILVKRVYLWPLILLYQHQQFTTTHRRNKLSLFWVQNLDHHLRSKAEWGCYFSFKLGSHENQHCALFWGAKLSLECFIWRWFMKFKGPCILRRPSASFLRNWDMTQKRMKNIEVMAIQCNEKNKT